jgi:hypothetical protein
MSRYYGVIGNRDYIKLHGEKRPFWEFLDEQPDGWLSSLVYKRRDLPVGKPMIWDCGAWSYRLKDEPDYTPQQCADLYREYAPAGSTCIAPDHMLIPGCDAQKRREINLRNAAEFLRVCDPAHTPMATIHGETLKERVAVALALDASGYSHLAIGGLAAQAARKTMATEIVQTLRTVVPDVHLHVLGLSSPEYAKRWNQIGVDTFDGSSHFKQAFTAGAFYTQDGMKLTKHQAARPGNADCLGIVAPECRCRACALLREDGVDTRTYGSNETNMGRAAHNLNMLMRAQKEATRKHIVLVACCGKKAAKRTTACDLYQSELFKKSRRYAEQHGDCWFILSALHGVVDPREILDPYDVTLNGMSAQQRTRWNEKVALQLDAHRNDKLTVLAGSAYCGWVSGFSAAIRPMAGMGIGQQLAWLITQNTTPQQTTMDAILQETTECNRTP